MARKSISTSAMRQVLSESMGVCMICRTPIGRNGQIAHIVSPAGGPRSSDPLPAHLRDEADNLIYICRDTHWEIDSNPDVWPVERLRVLKAAHAKARERFFQSERAWHRAVFADAPEAEIFQALRDMCAGQSLLLRQDQRGVLDTFRNSVHLMSGPGIHQPRLDRARELIDELLELFDRYGEHLHRIDGPVTRVMFYNEGDPSTFSRRDEFWRMYERAERQSAELVGLLLEMRKPIASLIHGDSFAL